LSTQEQADGEMRRLLPRHDHINNFGSQMRDTVKLA
jgi:hypothetical protein